MNREPSGYYADLLDQPRALRATLAGLREQTVPASLVERMTGGAFRRVVLTGMGSSFFALHPLYSRLVQRGIHAVMMETSELLYALPELLLPDSLVVAVSQSGRSAEMVSLLERKSARTTILGVTNTPGSPLDVQSDARVFTQAGEETTVSCKTYVATLAALSWLDLALTGESTGRVLADLDRVPGAVDGYLAFIQEHQTEFMKHLKDITDIFVLGRGESLAAVGTGGLIIKEAAHFHAEGMSSAAYRHGPFEMLSPRVFVMVYEGSGQAALLNRRLGEDVLQAGGKAGLVSDSSGFPSPLRIPTVPEAGRPIVEILPAQMLTLALSELKGHEAGKFTRLTKITTVE